MTSRAMKLHFLVHPFPGRYGERADVGTGGTWEQGGKEEERITVRTFTLGQLRN